MDCVALGNRSRAGAPESGREALAYACHFEAAFTNEPLFLLVGAVFFLFGLWMLYRSLRKPKIT